jgi:hypothetical protein
MSRIWIVFSFSICMFISVNHCQAQLETAVFERVIEISATADHRETGTAFFAQIDHSMELVTARHVLEAAHFPESGTIYFNSSAGWHPLKMTAKYSDIYDLALMHIDGYPSATQGIPLCVTSFPIEYQTTLYFLGFPFGIHTDAVTKDLPQFLPYVKRAGLAGAIKNGFTSSPLLVLDGLNNYGFSRGPVLIVRNDIEPFKACVCGVTIGYLPGSEKVRDVRGRQIPNEVPYNSGLMYAVPANGVLNLAKKPSAAAK